jgi:hypothetical protein
VGGGKGYQPLLSIASPSSLLTFPKWLLISSRLFLKMNQQKAVKLLEFVACLNDALFSLTRFGADGAS